MHHAVIRRPLSRLFYFDVFYSCHIPFGLFFYQVIEAAIESGVDDVEVVEGDDEGTSWVLTTPKDLMTLAGMVWYSQSFMDVVADAGAAGAAASYCCCCRHCFFMLNPVWLF